MQGFDDLDRLVGREIDLGPGVGGDTEEAFAYDALGRLTEATDDDSTVQMAYDSLSRVLTEAQGGNPPTRPCRARTDCGHRVTRAIEIAFGDGVHSFTFRARLCSRRVALSGDESDRLVGRAIDLGPGVGGDTEEAFACDALGRLTEATDDDSTFSAVGQMTYDSPSRVLTEAQGGNPLGDEAKSVSYAWDAESNRTLLTYPSGFEAHEERDVLGRLTAITLTDCRSPGGRPRQYRHAHATEGP